MISAVTEPVGFARSAGEGRLEVEQVGGKSAAVTVWATTPLKLLTPRSRGRSVWAALSSYGGGLVAGDRNLLNVKLGAESRCFVTTQASTKVYRNPRGLPSGHTLRADLAQGSLLVLAPDPVQAFAASTYIQEQEFHLAPKANLALLDWCCSGRVARGERWAFGSFRSRNRVHIDGTCVFIDSLQLDPADGALPGPGRMGRFNCVAMLVLTGPLLTPFAQRLLEDIGARTVERRGALVASASPMRDGAVLRVAGETVESVGRELHRHLAPLAELLGDDPWARKW